MLDRTGMTVFGVILGKIWTDPTNPTHAYLIAAISGTIYEIYAVISQWKLGSTFGKSSTGLKLISDDTQKNISLKQSTARELGPIIMFAAPFLLVLDYSQDTFNLVKSIFVLALIWNIIDAFVFIINKKHKTLQDILTKVTCVPDPNWIGSKYGTNAKSNKHSA
jgi:uncharacterized RDD family membrane protein YckC